MRIAPASLFLIRLQKGKKHGLIRHFQGLVISSNLGPSSASDSSFDGVNDASWFCFGLVLTWAQVSEEKVGAGLAKGYVFTLRCTPPIVLLFLVFYGLPQFLNWWLGIDIDYWSKFVFVLVAMFLLFAAMISEVFKAAYLAIPKGQMEAGLSIGLTPAQTIWRIVLPQAFRVALPNMRLPS